MFKFDPLQTFVLEAATQSNYSHYCDALIWFLKLSYMYHCAQEKNMINEIDFKMFYYLCSSNKKKVLERYKAKTKYWENIDNENQRQPKKNFWNWI